MTDSRGQAVATYAMLGLIAVSALKAWDFSRELRRDLDERFVSREILSAELRVNASEIRAEIRSLREALDRETQRRDSQIQALERRMDALGDTR